MDQLRLGYVGSVWAAVGMLGGCWEPPVSGKLSGGWWLGDCWEGATGMHLRGSWEVSGRLCGGRWEVLARLLGRLMGQPGRFL